MNFLTFLNLNLLQNFMAKTNDNQQSGSLNDFSFDGEDNWFGVDAKTGNDDGGTTVIKEVKSSGPTSSAGTTPSTKIDNGGGDDDSNMFDNDPDLEDDGGTTFFGQEVEEDEIDEDDKEKKTKTKKKAPAKKKEDVDEDNPDLEEPVEEEDGVTNLDDKSTTKTKEKSKENKLDEGDVENNIPNDDEEFFPNLTKDLKERGIFAAADLKEGDIKTEDQFFDAMEIEIDTRVNEAFEDFYDKLDEDAKAFIKFKKNGGRTADYFSVAASPIDYDNFDEKNPDHIQAVLTHYMATQQELDNDEIKEQLEFLKTGGKERATASKWFAKLKAARDKQLETITETATKIRNKKIKDAEEFDNELIQVLESTETVGAFPITKTDQKELKPYFTKASVKVDKNRYVTEFQRDLAKVLKAATKEDKQKLIAVGKLLKEDFKVKDLVKETATKVTQQVKSNIASSKSRARTRTANQSATRSLSDFF